MRAITIGLFVLASLGAGCSQSTTAPSTTVPSPATETFASNLVVGGSTSHAFNVLRDGNIAVTLTSTGPPGVVVGLGIGIPFTGAPRGCALSTAVSTAAGTAAQITIPVDVGSYCVAVYDPGGLTDAVSFNVTIVHL